MAIAVVTALFWGRVVVAIGDRDKRDLLEKKRKEIMVKKLSGGLRPGEEDELRRIGEKLQQ